MVIIKMVYSNKCPKCGSKNINTDEIHHFDGVLIDYICKDCMYSWSHRFDKKDER